MKKFIELKLKFLAKLILKKYQPEVVGITGSVGKTSAKEAIYTVLAAKFNNVRRSLKNYNNEIGVPLTIIGADSPGRSFFGWLKVFFKAWRLILARDKNYPRILVLEMAVDRPGDMKYLLSIVKCRVGVVTMIGPVHLEFFGSIEKIKKEKGRLIKSLRKSGWAILNYDNEKTRQMRALSRARVLTYGFSKGANIRAQEMNTSFGQLGQNLDSQIIGVRSNNQPLGINFKISYNGSVVPVFLPGVLGQAAVYAALAAVGVGIAYGLNLMEIAKALGKLKFPPGRMNLIPGIKYTLIIDDTYNASPQSVMAALDVLREIPVPEGARKYAVLGDMLELGSYSEEGHRTVGRYIVKAKVDKLIVVGERSRDIARGAREAGMSEDDIFHFPYTKEAGLFLQERIKAGDLILVKGSQGARMEKIVKEIMADPLHAKDLLVRQGKEWESKDN